MPTAYQLLNTASKMITLKAYLKQAFRLKQEELESVYSFFKPIKLKKNEIFLREGSRCNYIVFINEGIMRNYVIDETGQEIVKYMTSDGDFNTVYKCFVNQEVCREYIQAVTNCDLSVINRADFFKLKEESKSFQNIVETLVLEGLTCKEQRLHSYLSDDAQKRYENLIIKQPKVVQFAPLRHIASYLGISRETLSRIRNRKISRA